LFHSSIQDTYLVQIITLRFAWLSKHSHLDWYFCYRLQQCMAPGWSGTILGLATPYIRFTINCLSNRNPHLLQLKQWLRIKGKKTKQKKPVKIISSRWEEHSTTSPPLKLFCCPSGFLSRARMTIHATLMANSIHFFLFYHSALL